MEEIRPKICIIGGGNVGSHLARALSEKGRVCQIMCRHKDRVEELCRELGRGCEAIDDPRSLRNDADFYIIAVNDDSVRDVVDATSDFPGIWAHTSGSVPMDVFKGKKSRYGVFYPLQTFTRGLPVKMDEVPFLIEGNRADVTSALMGLARTVSHTVEQAGSERRKMMHLAAVFACNFANLMWIEADGILQAEGLSIKFLLPLLRATLGKLEQIAPEEAMTGPARRGDCAVIEKHKSMLDDDRKEIYELLSSRILKKYSHE